MENKDIEEILSQIDNDSKARIEEPASKVIKLLLSDLNDDIENYKQRMSNIKKSQDIARHRPRREYDKKLRGLEKGKKQGWLTEKEYERKRDHIKKAFNFARESLEKKEGPKGKENLDLNIVVETFHYLLTTYAAYSPTSKAPNTIASLLNLSNISKDKGNEFNRTDINSILYRNLKFDYRSYIIPLVDSLLRPIPPNQTTSD